jgi:hypothetical protein
LLLTSFFVVCLSMLIGSLFTFIVDMHWALRALRLQMGQEKPGTAA